MSTLTNRQAFLVSSHLRTTASKLTTENDAIKRSFGDVPLNAQFMQECDERDEKIEAFLSVADIIDRIGDIAKAA